MHCDAHTGPEIMEIESIGKEGSQFLYSHFFSWWRNGFNRGSCLIEGERWGQSGAGELREAYGSDFGWYGIETGEEGDKDMGSVFKKAYRHTYII